MDEGNEPIAPARMSFRHIGAGYRTICTPQLESVRSIVGLKVGDPFSSANALGEDEPAPGLISAMRDATAAEARHNSVPLTPSLAEKNNVPVHVGQIESIRTGNSRRNVEYSTHYQALAGP